MSLLNSTNPDITIHEIRDFVWSVSKDDTRVQVVYSIRAKLARLMSEGLLTALLLDGPTRTISDQVKADTQY